MAIALTVVALPSAAIAVFLLWCMAIVIGSGIVRELRRVVAGIARTA
jgi:hypothetical protein